MENRNENNMREVDEVWKEEATELRMVKEEITCLVNYKD
jgi:hypothetical protein